MIHSHNHSVLQLWVEKVPHYIFSCIVLCCPIRVVKRLLSSENAEQHKLKHMATHFTIIFVAICTYLENLLILAGESIRIKNICRSPGWQEFRNKKFLPDHPNCCFSICWRPFGRLQPTAANRAAWCSASPSPTSSLADQQKHTGGGG